MSRSKKKEIKLSKSIWMSWSTASSSKLRMSRSKNKNVWAGQNWLRTFFLFPALFYRFLFFLFFPNLPGLRMHTSGGGLCDGWPFSPILYFYFLKKTAFPCFRTNCTHAYKWWRPPWRLDNFPPCFFSGLLVRMRRSGGGLLDWVPNLPHESSV